MTRVGMDRSRRDGIAHGRAVWPAPVTTSPPTTSIRLAREALAGDGVKPAASIREAAAGADVLVVMVATPDQVEAVLFGDDPAAEALASGAIVLVMATVGPAPVERWAERLAERQVDLVDAPVSGGAARAAAGDLLIMVGGAEPAVRRVAAAARRDGPQRTARRGRTRRRAEGQARQPAAVRRPHRRRRRSPRPRRGDAARSRRDLGGPPRRRRRVVHARRPRRAHGARHRRGQERARHLRQGHGTRDRRRARRRLPHAAGIRRRAALPRRAAGPDSAVATTRRSSRCSAAPADVDLAGRSSRDHASGRAPRRLERVTEALLWQLNDPGSVTCCQVRRARPIAGSGLSDRLPLLHRTEAGDRSGRGSRSGRRPGAARRPSSASSPR